MASSGILRGMAALATLLCAMPLTQAGELKRAVTLSEALGGSLDGGLIVADFPGHGRLDTTVPLKRGRGDEYRGRVASLVAQSHLPTSAH